MMRTMVLWQHLKRTLMVGGFLLMIINIPSWAQNRGILHDAVEKQDYAEIQSILGDKNIKIDETDFQKRTALMMAVQRNDVQAAKLLIEAGANVNMKNNIHDTPYLLAGAEGYNEILLLTLENGANLEDTNCYGGTAIIPASEKGHFKTVEILLDAGINPNHVNNLGWTALMEAVLLGNGSKVYVDIVNTLIKGNADPNIPDKKGVTALQYAKQRGFKEIAEILENAGGK